MNWRICLGAAAAAALLACGTKSTGTSSSGGTLTITTSAASVVANGTTSVVIHVDGSSKGPVAVVTDRGHFQATGTTAMSAAATPFDATLVTCNAGIDPSCKGTAYVRAGDQNLASGHVTVEFLSCAGDCSSDACAGQICGSHGLTCSATSPSVCECPTGQTHELPGQCSDGIDNDCDGLIDCADPDCDGQQCNTGAMVNGNLVIGSCTSGACSCVKSASKETNCADGRDDDCNGLVDCDDPACQPVGNAPGGICDALGHTCSPKAMTGGRSICGVVCSGNGGTPQLVETLCGDGFDNDCNGVADCQDPNCASLGLSCSTNGRVCSATSFQCICTGPEATTGEQTCDDGIDNDCNGYIDCKDLACNGRRCGPNGRVCNTTANGSGSCTCPGGTAEVCNDGIDNNCDGMIDCADSACRPTAPGLYGQLCGTDPSRVGLRCDYSGQCVCPGGQSRETSCADGLDNDCNGYIDCLDVGCNGQACGPNGRVCSTTANGNGSCVCPGGTTEVCNDGVDNNCDGLVDCADPQCQSSATPCDALNPNKVCTNVGSSGAPNWVCKDSSQFAIAVRTAPTRIPADGAATSIITATVQSTPAAGGSSPVSGATVLFSVSPPGLATVTGSVLTDLSGVATATLTSASVTSSGTATVTASYTPPSATTITAQTSVTLPILSGMSLVSQLYPVMGARGSGYQELNTLTFLLTDSAGNAYPPGLQVNFQHKPLAGSYIGTVASCTPALNPTNCTASGVTDAAGKVSVLLHSGQTAGVVSVIAQAVAGGAQVQYTASNIAIVGAKASGAEITLNCLPRNIPAFTDQDCTNSYFAGSDPITCTVTLADRYKNALGVATVATFQTEAGIAGPPATTPAYQIGVDPVQQTSLGVAKNFVRVNGGKLPADVTPFLGEASVTHGLDGCGPRVHNPRDGLVTVIVKVRGEEGFVDGSNGCPRDGLYTPPGALRSPSVSCSGLSGADLSCCTLGENFIDIGEPFVDYNDNGQWDPGEPYDDINGNGQYDGPNGAWDADTTIWAETRVLYSGYEVVAQSGGLEAFSRFYDTGLPPAPTSPASFAVYSQASGPPVVPATSQTLPIFFTDWNYNLPNYKYVYSTTKSGGSQISTAFTAGIQPTTLDSLGMSFRQLYCSSLTPADIVTDCANTCNWAPCYPVTNVSSFQYGTWGSIAVTGGTTADAGPVCAYATGSLTTTSSSGQTATVATTALVCGTNSAPP